MHAPHKGRSFTLLLVVVLLIACFTAVLPTVSAEPAEIGNFCYQTLSTLDPSTDEATDLRFLFTVGSLDYDEVGFIFSKTNDDPTINGDGCVKRATTTVYGSVTADGKALPAPEGRWWVAVKMTGIPQSYFDGSLYVRPFVTDENGTRYGDAAALSVRSAYAGRNAPSVYDVQIFSDETDGTYSPYRATLGEIRGAEHFYDPDNDLLIEFSILWNESLTRLLPGAEPYMDVRFTPDEEGLGEEAYLVCWWLAANDYAVDCPYAGGFEWGGIHHAEADCPYPRFTYDNACGGLGELYEDFPNLGGTDEDKPEWGWHRVGIRYREELINAEEVREETADAAYNLEMWVYIDGTLVIHTSATDLIAYDDTDRKLFSAASDGAGGIAYVENDNLYLHGAFLNSTVMTEENTGYFAIADYAATLGSDFVLPVCKVADPSPATLEVEAGVFVTATVWYEPAN
ncbi:MAG: hypothetical protein IKP74_07190 [Clostridia bacterium]|nr:hypothetical protein [Clostridia bacterium]